MTTHPSVFFRAASLLTYSDTEAQQLLASPEFRSEWKSLVNKSPWSTALQTPEFACTWYECYRELYRPLILVRYAGSGEMDGLLTLAIPRASGELTFAGAHQAEYQVWLALPSEQSFICEALARLRQLGFPQISFSYLPPGTPLEWLQKYWISRSAIRIVRKPLLTLDNADAVYESLNKKKNRRRLEKLQAEGPLSFLELRSTAELDTYYQDIIDFYDFRMGAIHGCSPFREDIRKRSFYRRLMEHVGQLHVTVMKIGEQLVAAHIGLRTQKEVTLGIVAHSPFQAIHSPGKLHILQLGHLLHDQGFCSLDLTPGGDSYKEDRATRYEDAYVLTVFLDSKRLVRHKIAASARSATGQLFDALHVSKVKIKYRFSFLRRAIRHPLRSLRSLLVFLRQRLWSSGEMRFYRLATKEVVCKCDDVEVHRDSVHDLLCYSPREDRSLPAFLQDALTRIESGAHVYSVVRDNVLIAYGWLSLEIQKSLVTEIGYTYKFPPHSAYIWDLYTDPAHRGQKLCSRLLAKIMSDVVTRWGAEFIYIATFAGNLPSRHIIERAGFHYHGSVRCDVRFGVSRCTAFENP